MCSVQNWKRVLIKKLKAGGLGIKTPLFKIPLLGPLMF